MVSDTSFLTCLSSVTTAAGLHFVVSTDLEKPNAELRNFIRSHCMLGKNRGRILPPRKRKPKKTATVSHHTLPDIVPRKFGSDLSAIRFADAVEPRVVEVVLQCGS